MVSANGYLSGRPWVVRWGWVSSPPPAVAHAANDSESGLSERAVLDTNVIILAVLAPHGTPANLLRAWLDGAFELVASDALLAELDRALAYPKLRKRIDVAESQALNEILRREAHMADDPVEPTSVRSPDPSDDYLPALGRAAGRDRVRRWSSLRSRRGAAHLFASRVLGVAPRNWLIRKSGAGKASTA